MTGTEEPGEFAFQYTHHYHSAPGRAENSFCYTWLSQVLGVRPGPLFIYVYHPYHISMDRWPYLGHDSDFERRALVVTLTWGKQINRWSGCILQSRPQPPGQVIFYPPGRSSGVCHLSCAPTVGCCGLTRAPAAPA